VRPSQWPQTLKQLVLRMHQHNSTRPSNIVVASAVHACQERCLAPTKWTVRLLIATEPLPSNNGLADWTLRSGNYSMSIIRPTRDPSPCGSRIYASDAPPPEESTPGHTAPGTAAKGYRSFTTRIQKLGGESISVLVNCSTSVRDVQCWLWHSEHIHPGGLISHKSFFLQLTVVMLRACTAC
jgi:hypothetical protein